MNEFYPSSFHPPRQLVVIVQHPWPETKSLRICALKHLGFFFPMDINFLQLLRLDGRVYGWPLVMADVPLTHSILLVQKEDEVTES